MRGGQSKGQSRTFLSLCPVHAPGALPRLAGAGGFLSLREPTEADWGPPGLPGPQKIDPGLPGPIKSCPAPTGDSIFIDFQLRSSILMDF